MTVGTFLFFYSKPFFFVIDASVRWNGWLGKRPDGRPADLPLARYQDLMWGVPSGHQADAINN